ncbi:MAG TPA: hypothetical protein VHL52_01910 [Acidimicrobiia bacterium]|nr:hypothetical protein [Acidimicrobiia bacterium]
MPCLCALTSALSGRHTLAEEWGGRTAPGRETSTTWEWSACGEDRSQFMAAEDELAAYVGAVLPRLVEVGSTGALLWCFADYREDLWDRRPCEPDGARDERHFGLVRPDGTLKPHAEFVKRSARSRLQILVPARKVELDVSPDEYYRNPASNARRLSEQYLTGG